MQDKETFDTVAVNYDKYRPEYPNELFADIISYSNLQTEDKILEIGCGTGQATGGLVHNGFQNITCVELGTNLAQITSNKFKDYSSVQVIRSSFEDWEGHDESYDLAISATAFHFIEPKFGYQKVSRLLKYKGTKGFFWTVHVQQYDEIHTELRKLYKSNAPHLDDSTKKTPDEIISDRKVLTENSGLFENITVFQYKWLKSYSSEEYIALLNTHSKHQQLPDNVRNTIFEKMRNIIDGHGGYINKQQLVALYLGRKVV
jgi:ubiquinone/menaquinone biosynthesis C-methylase UbiE